jgi:polysaccharide biosynthesis/export protein
MKRVLITTLALLGGACRHDPGRYVWVDDVAPVPTEGEYVIRSGDVVNVRVFGQESMSARARVRADGKISLPFLNDVTAAGVTPAALSAHLQNRLKDVITTPIVTVSLEEPAQVQVSVLGEVPRAGIYTLDSTAGVLQALAAAGGFNNYAARELFVLRNPPEGGARQRIRFDYEVASRAEGKAGDFRLKQGDVLIVE